MFKKRTRPAGVRDRAASSTPLDSGAASSSSTPGPDSQSQPLAGPSSAATEAGADSSRPRAGTSGGGAAEDGAADADNSTDPDTSNIDELILLRKLRKAKQGIDLQRLNRGEDKHKHRGGGGSGSDSGSGGLQTQQKSKTASKEDRGDPTDDFADEAERLKNLVRSNNFTQQTNALDVDRHM
jgi:hypothetical protein